MEHEYTNVIGVQFRRAGKIYDFVAGELAVCIGEHVVVDTDRGPTLAKIVTLDAKSRAAAASLKGVMRKASDKDLLDSGGVSSEEAQSYAKRKVEEAGLNMRIMKAETQLGGNKVMVYFSAPGRVDFRNLVKDLAGGLRARVELKQVGARDEAKLVGGLGICGREFCCSSFLREFVPVSIKMAKNQNLALNPSKVSGGCGRLLCCLTYENDVYTELRTTLPPLKSKVFVADEGLSGIVLKTDILNQNILVQLDDGRVQSVKANLVEWNREVSSEASTDLSEAEIWGEDINLDLLVPKSQDNDSRKQSRRNPSSKDKDGRGGVGKKPKRH
jgi:cell fate regulator YaaT (PSP1 superfamily)